MKIRPVGAELFLADR